ncbi:MAG: glycosyltransferase family 2 protein [Lysobacteraceae bacterium]
MNSALHPISVETIDASRIAVLIPALNEELRIREVVQAALVQCQNVIVVDDGSTDSTCECIADLPVTMIRHAKCKGKGESLRDGFKLAMERGFEGVLTMDGDGQHSARDIPRLLRAAARYPQRIVIGARLRKRAQQPTYRRLANEFGDWGIAWACGYPLADSQSGQRYYPIAVAALADVAGEGFVFEADILIQASRQLGTQVVAVPIESRYQGPDLVQKFRRSHFRPLRDLYRITSHTIARIFEYGHPARHYRLSRSGKPDIFDDAPVAETDAPATADNANFSR